MTDQVNLCCDFCGSRDYKIRFLSTLKKNLAASNFTVFGELGEYPQIVDCDTCGLTYANPRDDGSALEAKYTEMSVCEYLAAEESRRAITQRDAKFVQKLMREQGRVLDIGCSAGLFLSSLGQDWERHGIELSRAAIAAARERVPDASFYNVPLSGAKQIKGPFDLITMWDVIEHLDSPTQALEQINTLLADSGHLVIVTPDIGSWLARLMGRRWPHLIRGHLYYFKPKTMAEMLKKTGYEITFMSRYTRFFRISYILRRIGLISDEVKWARYLGPLDLRLPILTGDCMQIVARKAART